MSEEITTVQGLVAAYQSGAVTAPLMIGDDTTDVYDEVADKDVFSMHPADLLEQALTLLGIPWEHV